MPKAAPPFSPLRWGCAAPAVCTERYTGPACSQSSAALNTVFGASDAITQWEGAGRVAPEEWSFAHLQVTDELLQNSSLAVEVTLVRATGWVLRARAGKTPPRLTAGPGSGSQKRPHRAVFAVRSLPHADRL
jgi:hypothetical protein